MSPCRVLPFNWHQATDGREGPSQTKDREMAFSSLAVAPKPPLPLPGSPDAAQGKALVLGHCSLPAP
jgi:hypothetical protein